MALNLNLPASSESSLMIAETNSRKISQALSNLTSSNPLDIASYLFTELEILNRQKISPNDRIQALDTYSPVIINTASALSEIYSNAPLPLHDDAKLAAAAAESLWLELGYGYKIALIDLQNKLIKIGTTKSSAHTIQRAIHAISEHALVYYQTYLTPPEHIWADLHQLYFCAVQLGIQNSKTSIENNSSVNNINFSVENAYIHALLMSLADPQHLTQRDMRLVADFLAHHVDNAKITAVTPLDLSSSTFIINLKSDKPPTPYNKQKATPDPNVDILLHTLDLVRIVHQHLSSLQNNQWPKDGSIPNNSNRNDYIDLLTHLIKYWGVTPKRAFNRSQIHGEIELVAGITAIHQLDGDTLTANHDVTGHANIRISSVKNMPSLWQILNISPTGMSIRRHPTAEKNIRIGSILATKTKNESHWSIGIVRWASCGARDKLDIGVQLIAPHANSAIARIDGREQDEMVLVLPEITATTQATSIIAPRGIFEPARQLSLTCNGKIQQIMLTKLTERSSQFERIQYSVLS